MARPRNKFCGDLSVVLLFIRLRGRDTYRSCACKYEKFENLFLKYSKIFYMCVSVQSRRKQNGEGKKRGKKKLRLIFGKINFSLRIRFVPYIANNARAMPPRFCGFFA